MVWFTLGDFLLNRGQQIYDLINVSYNWRQCRAFHASQLDL